MRCERVIFDVYLDLGGRVRVDWDLSISKEPIRSENGDDGKSFWVKEDNIIHSTRRHSLP